MRTKLKKCSKCEELKVIWKRDNKELYCKDCWYKNPDRTKKESLKLKKPLNKKSSKQQKIDVLYSKLREVYLNSNPYCKAKLSGCQINATDIHHMAGRGKFILDSTTFLPVCRICHGKIEENPVMAKAMGFSCSREEIYGNKEKGASSD